MNHSTNHRPSVFTTSLMVSTAILTAGRELLVLAFYLLAHLITGRYTDEARRRARAPRLWTILQATGTERKVMLFEHLIHGPVGQTFGANNVMEHIFDAITEPYGTPDDPDDTLNALLATRYDESTGAAFYLEATLNPDDESGSTLEYLTAYVNYGGRECAKGAVFYAAWPDATHALLSYYGTGESEMAAIGFGDDSASGGDAEGMNEDSAA